MSSSSLTPGNNATEDVGQSDGTTAAPEMDHFPNRGVEGQLLVKASDAAVGAFGLDRVHAKGATMRMREWKNVPVGFSFEAHDYVADIIGYVTKGKALWTLDGVEYTFEKGDSYYLPKGCMYAVKEVLEEFEAIEVTSEGAKVEE